MCINIYAYICAYVHIYVYIRCITTINEKRGLEFERELGSIYERRKGKGK